VFILPPSSLTLIASARSLEPAQMLPTPAPRLFDRQQLSRNEPSAYTMQTLHEAIDRPPTYNRGQEQDWLFS
jgi:hypothetical protein